MKDLDVQDRHENDRTVVVARGEIDIRTAGALRDRIAHLVTSGHHHLVIDLRAVTFMDSTCLGVLVGGLRLVRSHGGTLELVIEQQRFLQILAITGLNKIFTVHADLDELAAPTGTSTAAERAACRWQTPGEHLTG